MSKKMNRRGFLKALPFLPQAALEEIKEDKPEEILSLIRPPYSDKNSDFSLCSECDGKCVQVCEEKILFRYKDGSPYVSFDGKGCTFCKKCAEVCDFEVLSLEKLSKIEAIFKIEKNKCLAWNGTMCFSCKEPCLDNAIKFQGIFYPEIDTDLCSGCGFCIQTCPSQAISVKPLEVENA
ncbi:MAG: ferredoxin-type protein NapF [Aquificae bacterium]|nr:ferredoxin-type protein NapF [Aquificota bacterium]